MALVTTFQVGGLRCHALEGGRQRLDGGAMFGVVPRPLWEKRAVPDARHRIPLAMRCLLVEHPDGLVLIDTALGNKEPDKFLAIYGVENEGLEGATQLEDALATAGFLPQDVRLVINTHLHFDHAGGNTTLDPELEQDPRRHVRMTFPRATYVVQRGELEFARHTNERTRASYLPPNFEPIAAADRWRLVEGEAEIVPGIRVRPTPGHVPFHQAVLVSDRGETAAFVADLIPTAAHLPLPWIMGYDLEPLRTLESKRAILRQAAAEGWRLVFEHDPAVVSGVPVVDGSAVELRDVVAAPPASAGRA
ncbi:MAG TPA: MBL fold metallo-hydrolase [Gemmatimonadales bacterium]|jgi:glyoxylase-like metal-dependent hydrolase (beta-lactamase superfamily II)|nr:MBL fold metallo-hydrolase [Gemmatimonadales bacterium]